ncbi:MAG: hypothetical protein HUU20_20915 [Pirellulales bacterium]|nr:hypothetical protein [Pirellulales bacterium]
MKSRPFPSAVHRRRALRGGLAALLAAFAGQAGAADLEIRAATDPLARQIQFDYGVPHDAPEEVVAICSWSPVGKDSWSRARVVPRVSETAIRLVDEPVWNEWLNGRVKERRAAGQSRGVIFSPYPDAQQDGRVDIVFRIEIQTTDGKPVAAGQVQATADNRDVAYLEDWSKVLPADAVSAETKQGDARWLWEPKADPAKGLSFNNGLSCFATGPSTVPQLSLDLGPRGWYAVFVKTPARYGIGLRFTGDERADAVGSSHPYEEVFWRWAKLDHQRLVLKQQHTYTGYAAAAIDYIKLVPLTEQLLARLHQQYGGKDDRILAGYFEPYSWAFGENVQSPLDHRQPLAAFKEAHVELIDCQMGRFGSKANYESEILEQIVTTVFGDPIEGVVPTTNNVARMMLYTNTLDAELRYARELGMRLHANFGATACYTGSMLEAGIARNHPEWKRGDAVRYEVAEVRKHILSIYREMLELGATGISIDFCRYPGGIDKPETCNQVLREIRALADEFGASRGTRVPLLVRFPAHEQSTGAMFDYPTWIREGLVDYLCPSNIQARHIHFDIGPYVKAVQGSKTKLLPVVDALWWSLDFPGPYLWRVKQLLDAGVDGIYVYQCDARVLGRPDDRRTIRLLASTEAVNSFWKRDAELRERATKGIYLNRSETIARQFGNYERARVWLEGIPMGEVEFHLDGKFINRCSGPPYVLGTEADSADAIYTPAEKTLRIRAKDGDGWIEETYQIGKAAPPAPESKP